MLASSPEASHYTQTQEQQSLLTLKRADCSDAPGQRRSFQSWYLSAFLNSETCPEPGASVGDTLQSKSEIANTNG